MRPGGSSNDSSQSSLLLLPVQGHAHSADKSGNAVIGIALTVLSTLVLAGRLVAEEFALTGTSLHPLQVLGYEGMWGTILVGISLPIVWVIPGSDIGEHTLTIHMLQQQYLEVQCLMLIEFYMAEQIAKKARGSDSAYTGEYPKGSLS